MEHPFSETYFQTTLSSNSVIMLAVSFVLCTLEGMLKECVANYIIVLSVCLSVYLSIFAMYIRLFTSLPVTSECSEKKEEEKEKEKKSNLYFFGRLAPVVFVLYLFLSFSTLFFIMILFNPTSSYPWLSF